jgi:hypothetical protein
MKLTDLMKSQMIQMVEAINLMKSLMMPMVMLRTRMRHPKTLVVKTMAPMVPKERVDLTDQVVPIKTVYLMELMVPLALMVLMGHPAEMVRGK